MAEEAWEGLFMARAARSMNQDFCFILWNKILQKSPFYSPIQTLLLLHRWSSLRTAVKLTACWAGMLHEDNKCCFRGCVKFSGTQTRFVLKKWSWNYNKMGWKIHHIQSPFLWPWSIFRRESMYIILSTCKSN